MSDQEELPSSYIPRRHRLPVQRFSSKKRDAMNQAADAWSLSLPQDDKVAVRLLNTYQSLLTGEKRLAALSTPMLTLLSEAMGFSVNPGETIEELRDPLEPFFYGEEDLVNLRADDFHHVADDLLREWATVVGIDYQLDREEIIQGLIAFQEAFQDEPKVSPVKQRVGTTPSATVTSLLTAVPTEQSPDQRQNKRPRLQDDHFLRSQEDLNWVPSKPGLCERITPIMGHELRTGYVVVYIAGDLSSPEVNTSLFVSLDDHRKLIWVVGDTSLSLPGLSEHRITSVPEDCKVFVLNAAGLAATSTLLGRWQGFAHAPGANKDSLNPRSVTQEHDRLVSSDERSSSSLAKMDREEEARPARILMEAERFACATGVSGKFDSDYALTTYALAVPACDRSLLGTTSAHLRCLAAGMFAFTLQEKKVQGTHLRAFHDSVGSEFRYVSQIQRALRVLGRVYDAIIHVNPQTQFFRIIFSSLIDLLDDGADRGLRDLPVAFVEERITELLVKMSCVIRHPLTDQLSRDELMVKLTDALHLDLGWVVTQGALFQMNHSSRRSSSSTAPAGKFKTPFRGRAVPLHPPSKTQRVEKPCFSHMALHLGVGSHGCRSGDRCNFGHDMSKFTAIQLRAAAESVSNANLRKRLLEALNTKSESKLLSPSGISFLSSRENLLLSPSQAPSSSLNSPLTRDRTSSQTEIHTLPRLDCDDSHLWESMEDSISLSSSAIDQALILADMIARHSPSLSSLRTGLTRQSVLDLLSHGELEFGKGKAVSRALEQFGDVVWSQEALTVDSADLRRFGDLQDMIRTRHHNGSHQRFNPERCDSVFKDDPEYSTLRDIATHGVQVDTNPTFRRQTSPPPLRPLHKQLLPVYRFHAMKLWKEGKALLLPPHMLEQAGCHFNPAHWTPKPGKAEGRFLGDCTNGLVEQVLNSVEVKSLVGNRFGPLSHPTISEVVDKIYEMSDKYGSLSALCLWKEDVVGAFGQFNYSPESSCLFAFLIDDDLALLQHTGMFGWTGSPYAFGVFSRALQRVASQRLQGRVIVYVDDFMGISSTQHACQDQLAVQSLLTDVFGVAAVNLEKSITPDTKQEFLGWHIDLVNESIRPSDRAIRKLVFCFFGVSTRRGQRVPLSQIQRLASLAYRYARGIVGASPFVYPLYHATKGPYTVTSRRLGSEARTCITFWRCIALILYAHPSHLAVPLSSFSSNRPVPSVRIWSDAGPYRLGVRVDKGDDEYWLAYISYQLPFDASEPRYQNTREFMGVVLGLLMLSSLGYRNCNVLWRGDNISALSWAQNNYVYSLSCQKTFFVYTWLSVWTQLRVQQTEHWRGVDMGDIDGLSRGYATAFDTYASGLPEDFLERVSDIFRHCDPTTNTASEPPSLSSLFLDTLSVLSSFLSL